MTEFTIEDSLKKHDKDKDGQISKKEFLGKKKKPLKWDKLPCLELSEKTSHQAFSAPVLTIHPQCQH